MIIYPVSYKKATCIEDIGNIPYKNVNYIHIINSIHIINCNQIINL